MGVIKLLVQDATNNFDIIVSNNIENKIFHGELSHFGFILKDNADEFIAAGLDVSTLEGNTFTYQEASDKSPSMIVYTSDVSNDKETYSDYKEAF